MRDKKRVTIDVEIPSDRLGSLVPDVDAELYEYVLPALAPASVEGVAVPPLPAEKPVIVFDITS